jgi:hypothetical protein
MQRKIFTLALAAPLAFATIGAWGQGGDQGAPWKPFLPADAYKELTRRSIKVIEEAAGSGDKNASGKIGLEAVILAGYTLSAPNSKNESVATLRSAALAAPSQDIKKLTDFGKSIPALAKAPAKDLKASLPEVRDLMDIYRGKAKRGEGIHASLQYQAKLKNLNGIEALIGTLGAKKISDDNLAKIAGELPNLAYRLAVLSALAYEIAPAQNTAKWHELALQQRDASIALAEAAKKKNSEGVFQAAQKLENTCTACHREFKKQ